MLHIPKRVNSALVVVGVDSIGKLLDLDEAKLRSVPGLDITTISEINNILTKLLDSVIKQNVDWFKFWESIEISIIPDDFVLNVMPSEVVASLPNLLEQIILSEFDERTWIIIKRRNELGNLDKLTLEDLGTAFDIKRERVRQLENQAIKCLHDVLINSVYSGRKYRVHPEIQETIVSLAEFVVAETEKSNLENTLLQSIQQQFGIEPETSKASLFFLFSLLNIVKIEFHNSPLQPIWGIFDTAQKNLIEEEIPHLHSLLTQEIALPMSEIDILINLNKGKRKNKQLSLNKLRQMMELCSSVTEHSSGFYWGKFEDLTGRGNQVERILIENGASLHISEIVREINHRLALHGKRNVNLRNLGNQISVDDRFCPIGRSGEWGLASWALDTRTIVEQMKRCLTICNEPATVEQIYSFVKEHRPVLKSSIVSYLSFQDAFVKIDKTRWGLDTWAEASKTQSWNPNQVGEFVESIFKEHKTETIAYKDIKNALIQSSGVSSRQAQGLLNVNPVIKTHRSVGTKELLATFQPDYKKKLQQSGARFSRKKKTLRHQVDETVRNILENTPGQQVALKGLIKILKKKYNRNEKTFYQYISGLDYIDKFVIPEANVTMCRLRQAHTSTLILQVEAITTTTIKAKAGRALTFLNENDVDISLFLLSKEFEATLLNYLDLANSKGKLRNPMPSGINLDGMISLVKREGLISDQAVLHFLRQKRNDRSHGTMPSIEERRMMIKYSDITAGMYIDYIKFFDDLFHSL